MERGAVMFKIFRKVRLKLLGEGNVNSYLLYALGEIALVVIGILIALQLDNWNEERKQNQQFKLALEKVYNELDVEVQTLDGFYERLREQVEIIDQILTAPDSIPDKYFLIKLFYVDLSVNSSDKYQGRSNNISSIFRFESDNIEQLSIVNQISSYNRSESDIVRQAKNLITPILYERGIPKPHLIFGFSAYNNFAAADSFLYSKEEIRRARSFVKTEKAKVALKTIRSNRIMTAFMDLFATAEDARSIQKMIKDYHPEVNLLYDDLGIVGDATGKGWYESVPMTRTSEDESVWEVDIYLSEGHVKFRSRDSWNQNWGGRSFPQGKAIYFWEDIPVEAGQYHVILNLSDKTYEFIKQGD